MAPLHQKPNKRLLNLLIGINAGCWIRTLHYIRKLRSLLLQVNPGCFLVLGGCLIILYQRQWLWIRRQNGEHMQLQLTIPVSLSLI
ncbi:hypothetical protein D3C76_968230 [compost metagenome]